METMLMVVVILSTLALSVGLGVLLIKGLVNLMSHFLPKGARVPSTSPRSG